MKILKLLLPPLVVFVLAIPAVGQEAEWKRLSEQALSLGQQGNYVEGIEIAKKALAVAEKSFGTRDHRTASAMYNLAGLYKDYGRYSDAEQLYIRSLKILELILGKNHPHVAYPLNNLALMYTDQARYSEAEPLHKRSLEICERQLGKDHPEVATRLNNLGLLYVDQARYSEAEPLYKRAVVIWERKLGKDHPYVANALNNLAELYDVQGRFGDSESLWRRSLEIRERKLGKDHPEVALSLNNLAAWYHDQGRYSEAEPLYKRSLEICERKLGKDHPEVATRLNNLANLYMDQGRYSDAEPLHKRSLEIVERRLGKDHPHAADSLNNLALVYKAQGRYSDAEPLFRRSLEIRELKLGKNHPLVANSLTNLGQIQADRGDYQTSLRMYQQALSIETGKGLPVAGTKNQIAQLYLDQGDAATAESFLERGAISAPAGRLHLMKSEYDKAKDIYGTIRLNAEKNRNADDLFVAYTGLGLAYEGEGADRLASAAYRKAVDLTEELRSSLPREQRATFFDVRISGFFRTVPYEGLGRVLMRMNDPLSAVKASEYTKARAFSERSSAGASSIPSDVPSGVVQENEKLKDQLAALKKARQEAYQENNDDKIRYLKPQIKELEGKFSEHIQMLREKYPLFAATRYPQPMDLSQTALKPEEWVLEYDVTDTGILIYLTHGKEVVKGFFKPIPREEVDELLRKFREPLEVVPGRDDLVSKLKAFDFKAGKKLADLLLSDVLPVLPEGASVIVVPDDSLGIIPFEMLVLDDGGEIKTDAKIPYVTGARFLGDRNPLSYSQSITAMTLARTLGKSKGKGDRLLVLADPVYKMRDQRAQQAGSTRVASGKEDYYTNVMAAMEESSGGGMGFNRLPLTGELAERLGGMFPGKAAIYTGVAATRDNFFRKIAPDLKPYRSIVFATHGYFGTRIPGVLEPVLVLTTVPPGTDGFLRMSDIMGLRMNADVVALTACQTGLGRHISGEGTMGMGRAFQYAGAKSVLMSLWSVAEKSSVNLVESFFRHLKDGKNKLEALRLAREEIRKNGYDHPFFWAPFILVGETD